MRPLILDCDPGLDDAFALMLAARHLDLVGVTTVAGNVALEHTTANALGILDLIGHPEVPVHAGATAPLAVPLQTAAHIHGPTGLGDCRLPPSRRGPATGHAVDFLVDSLMSRDDLSLVVTGPMTNLALALAKEPRIAERAREVIFMGGSTTSGNVTVAAEFNIYADPEAAQRVLASGLRLRMCGLNLTRQAFVDVTTVGRMAALGTRTATFGAELLDNFVGRVLRNLGMAGADLHDALAVAWLIDPSLIRSQPMHVTVELHGTLTRGMTVCDHRHLRRSEPHVDISRQSDYPPRGEAANVDVGLDLDAPRFFDLLLSTIGSLP